MCEQRPTLTEYNCPQMPKYMEDPRVAEFFSFRILSGPPVLTKRMLKPANEAAAEYNKQKGLQTKKF